MSSIAESLQEAVNAHQVGDLPRAETIYREIVRVDPQHADALHLLGLAAHQRDQPKMAVDYISRAIEINDQFAPYYSNLGVACMKLGNREEAVRCFQKALEIDPNFADAYFNLGTLHFGVNNMEKAQECFERGLKIKEDDPLIWQNLGMVHESNRQFSQAKECYQRVCQFMPDSEDAKNDLVRVEQALETTVSSMIPEMLPSDVASVNAGDSVSVSESQSTEAESQKTNVGSRDNSENPDQLCRLADELARAGRLHPAIDLYRDALKLDTNHADALIGLGQTLKRLQTNSPEATLPTPVTDSQPDILSSVCSPEEVLSHMVNVIRNTPTIPEPFPHVYYSGIFPEEFFAQILEHLPETSYYEQLMHCDAILPNGESARRTFDLAPENISRLPKRLSEFWSAYAPIFSSQELVSAIFSRFKAPPSTIPQVRLYRDIAGYKILPHPDIPEKQVTTQFYFPRDNSRPHLGTCLYVEDETMPDGFRKVKQFSFSRNSGYSFEVSETSWHGVEETQITDGPRDSMMVILHDPSIIQRDY
ncbi:MAG: hypothetical protein Tsb009_05600 [Planctomycetaceae bacterium]